MVATSGGATASAATPTARCAAARPTIDTGATAVEARVLVGCTAGELVVFRAALAARVHGLHCSATAEELETDPATPPQWVRARLELVCAPGEKGRLGSRIAVDMPGARYSFGDSFNASNPSARHLWRVEFLAGVGELPVPVDPARWSVSGSAGEGGTRVEAEHELYDG
ncbi:hypothetical protein BBK82_10565 [Lentzea guizhouensis]|uniref:Uncharacterized protein n=1 Tax=Lentzea guizhouensis TaxID=1586287 RepID=A0A1B2HFD2_9PSEU|nr:hypothetical protein BBK82_10565 [Lentzea guizhouensis]